MGHHINIFVFTKNDDDERYDFLKSTYHKTSLLYRQKSGLENESSKRNDRQLGCLDNTELTLFS